MTFSFEPSPSLHRHQPTPIPKGDRTALPIRSMRARLLCLRAVKASFSHFSLAGRVNSQFQEFRVSFPFLLYEIQYKLGLTFPALQFFLFRFLFPSYQTSAKFCAGQCLCVLLLTVWEGKTERKRKKRNKEETHRENDC